METLSMDTKPNNREVIEQGIKALSEQLQAGNSEALTAYLGTMCRFHNYSFGNVMAIAMQRPDAVRVAGFHTWKSLGRNVKKGEKAIRILAPLIGKGKSVDDSGENDGTSPARPMVYGFRGVCVFDISQTEGKELPEFSRVSGDAGDVKAKLEAFASKSGIAVEYVEDLGGAEGISIGGTIRVLLGRSDAETVSVLSHELAHEILHKQADRRDRSAKNRRELEAEAVAFIVGQAIGLEVGTASADYIRLYDGNPETLSGSLEAISKAASLILEGIEA
jgi:antirestriction protein ArdC